MKTFVGFSIKLFGLWITVFILFPFLYGCDSSNSNPPSLPIGTNPSDPAAVSGSSGTGPDTYTNSGSGGANSFGPVGGSLEFKTLLELCDAEEFVPNRPVYMMLLQDMSKSLTVESEGKTKWEHAKTALTAILTDQRYKDIGIRFGFDYFPDTTINRNADNDRIFGCGVDDPLVVDTDLNTDPQIIEWLNSNEPNGATPLYCAINKFNDPNYAPQFMNANGDRYLILISDGADSCGIDGVSNEGPYASDEQLAQITSQLREQHGSGGAVEGIRTVAIGFGDSVAPHELNAICQAGGIVDEYISAATAEDLEEAFKTILCNI